MAKHKDEIGLSLHDLFHYAQAGDPGAVGAGKNWLDTTTPTAPVWKRRNPTDSGWMTMATAGSGTPHAAVTVTDSASINFTITGQDVTGEVIVEWLQDQIGAFLTDTTMIDVVYDDAGNVLSFALIFAGSGGAFGTAATAARSDHTHAGGTVTVALDDLTDVVVAAPAAGHVLMHDGTDWDNVALTGELQMTFSGGGSAISTGVKLDTEVPFDLTVVAWRLVGDGDVVIDLWKDSFANYPPTVADTVTGTEKPTLSGVTKNEDTNLTTWTDLTWTKGEIIRANVDSATATRAHLWVLYRRTGA